MKSEERGGVFLSSLCGTLHPSSAPLRSKRTSVHTLGGGVPSSGKPTPHSRRATASAPSHATSEAQCRECDIRFFPAIGGAREHPAQRVNAAENGLQPRPRAYPPRPALPHGVTVAQQTLNLYFGCFPAFLFVASIARKTRLAKGFRLFSAFLRGTGRKPLLAAQNVAQSPAPPPDAL